MITCKVIRERSSIRFFDKSRIIENEKIIDCIEAAANAPSPYNNQPWKFRIITSQEKINSVAALLNQNQWSRTAPVLIIVGVEKGEGIKKLKDYMAIGAAIENLLLEAQQKGISTCWIGECLGMGIEQSLKWPEDYEIASIIAMGYRRNLEMKKPLKKELKDLLV